MKCLIHRVVERHNHCLCLQVVVLQQSLLDDQVAVLAFGRQPLANLDATPIEFSWLLLIENLQATKLQGSKHPGHFALQAD